MEKDLVSVLMVNYNHADTIEKAVKSVLNQTYPKVQLIIVDDGSTDDSVEIVKNIKDSRIELYEENVNRQICAVTNIGMQKVRGEYFARIDSDDLWEENKLEIQLKYLKEHPEHEICFTHASIIDERDQIIDSDLERLYAVTYEKQEEWLETFFFLGNCLPMTSVLMKTKLMLETGQFNIAYRQLHDFDYWVRIAKKYPMAVIAEKLVGIRRYENETNNSNTSEINATRSYNEYIDIRKHFFDDMSDELFKRTFGKYFRNSDAESKEELECEKAFLLCRPWGQNDMTSNVGVEYLIGLFQNSKTAAVLEEKYGLNAKKLYDLTGQHLYNDEVLQKEIRLWKEKSEKIETEKKNIEEINERMKKEIINLQMLVSEYENSTSWKITKPLRKAGKRIRKK